MSTIYLLKKGATPEDMKPSQITQVVAIVFLGMLSAGCVSKYSYDRDVGKLSSQLQSEREQSMYRTDALKSTSESKAQTLSDLTGRYIALQKLNQDSQRRINNIAGDMHALLANIDELKLIISSNLQGAVAYELLFKLDDMENRIRRVIVKDADLTTKKP
jgi:outer membrane murein-binding lipoprotein Lpp